MRRPEDLDDRLDRERPETDLVRDEVADPDGPEERALHHEPEQRER